MIISSHHRFIFIAIPKTGTHAVRQALRVHLDADDLEQVGLFEKKRFPFEQFKDIGHGHISASQIKPVLGAEVFDSYFKFAFVRNPYDRFISYAAFMGRQRGEFAAAPLLFAKHLIKVVRPLNHILYRPQHELLIDGDGRLLTDYVGRNEDMQRSYDHICARIGIPSARLDKVNASQHVAYQQYYDRELFELVTALYARDLELFNYGFDRDAA